MKSKNEMCIEDVITILPLIIFTLPFAYLLSLFLNNPYHYYGEFEQYKPNYDPIKPRYYTRRVY